MATEVGSAYVSIIPSLRGFSSRVNSELARSGVGTAVERQLTSQATRAGTRTGGLFSRAFSRSTSRNINFPGPSASLLRNIRTYGYAVSGVATVTAGLGLKTESAMEQAKIAFTTMLGSAKQAQTFLAGLTKFAQTTPFDLPGVVTSSQKLLAFGFTAKQTLPTLTALGDAAAGLSLGTEGLDRLTTAIGQIQAKGKVQSDELLQLTEAGVPALKILANQFGTTTADMQQFVTKGLVPADKAIPALLQGLERGTDGLAGSTAKFSGLMEKQSHTLGGVVSNLKDTVSQGLARAVTPLARTLERVLPKAMARLPGVFEAVQRGVRRAIPAVERFVGKAKDIFDQLKPTLREFVHNAVDLAKALKPTAENFAKLAGAAVIAGIKTLSRTMRFLADHSTALRIAVDLLIARMLFLTSAQMLTRIWLLQAAFNPVGAALVGLTIGAEAAYSVVRDENAKAATDFARLAARGGKSLGDLEGKWVQLTSVAKEQYGEQAAATRALADAMRRGLEAAGVSLDNVRQMFVNVANDALFATRRIASFFTTLSTTAPVTAYAPGKRTFDPNAAVTGAIGEKVGKAKESAVTGGLDLGTSVGEAVSKGIKDSSAKVGKSFADLADKILTPLRDLLQKARQLAKQIADGITGNLGLGSLATSTDSLGAEFSTSLRGIISGLAGQRAMVRKFRRQIQQLENRGLSEAAIQSIVAMGVPDGPNFAATLLTASRRQLRRISRLNRGINRGANAIGTDIASDVYGPRIAAAIRQTERAIDKAASSTELGRKTVDRLEHAFTRAQRKAKLYLDVDKLDRKNGREVLAS